MMLEFLGENKSAQLIENSVQRALKREIKSLSAGKWVSAQKKWAILS